jgi:hypothetical protein
MLARDLVIEQGAAEGGWRSGKRLGQNGST